MKDNQAPLYLDSGKKHLPTTIFLPHVTSYSFLFVYSLLLLLLLLPVSWESICTSQTTSTYQIVSIFFLHTSKSVISRVAEADELYVCVVRVARESRQLIGFQMKITCIFDQLNTIIWLLRAYWSSWMPWHIPSILSLIIQCARLIKCIRNAVCQRMRLFS